MIVLNATVVLSTMTTGWHYASDVVGGVLTALAAVLITRRLEVWLTDEQLQPVPQPAI